MKRLTFLALLPISLISAHAAFANGSAPGKTWSQEPTPLDDPYIPPDGSPDIAGDDGLGEGSSPLNPAED